MKNLSTGIAAEVAFILGCKLFIITVLVVCFVAWATGI